MRNNLVEARKQRGYTQVKIASLLGVTEQHYQKLESGRSGTSEERWIKLFELFDKEIPLQNLMENTA